MASVQYLHIYHLLSELIKDSCAFFNMFFCRHFGDLVNFNGLLWRKGQ